MKRTASNNGLRILAVLGSIAMLAACGGGGSNAKDSALTLSALSDQVVNQDNSLGPLSVTIGGSAAQASDLIVTAMVADTGLVPSGNVLVSGSGTSRSLTLTPAPDQTGSTPVTLTVKDAAGHMASQTFHLIVNPVYAAFTQYTDAAFQADGNSTPKPVSGLTFQPDADSNDNAFATLLQ